MARKHKEPTTPKSITETLREAIAASGLSFNELERRTGVLRQSLMKFARGEQSLRLDHADKLYRFFGIGVTMNDALRVVSIKDLAGTNGREYVANADNIEAFDLSVNWNVWVYGKRSVGTLARDSTSSCYLVKRLRVEIRKDSDDMSRLLSLIESVKGHHDYIEDNSSGN